MGKTGKPVRLRPEARAKVWGRRRLGPYFPDSPEPIGEFWFLHDEELPLLVKFLFTSDKLSVQVHPDDGEDGPRGKTEMWHILQAEPGAAIALGFREPVARERLRAAALSGEVEGLLNWIPVRPGQTFFTPAHTVHAIGAGIVLCEVQQNSDVTYRLYDYGRPRPIHIERSLAVADLGVHPGESLPDPETGRVVECRHFVAELVRMETGSARPIEARPCHLWICLEGEALLGEERARAGETWLIEGECEVRTSRGARFLRAWTP